jgi:acid phosphatase (class A)
MPLRRSMPVMALELGLALAASPFSVAPAQNAGQEAAANPGAAHAGLPPGYLKRDQLPNSLALLPPPPAPGTGAMQRDEDAREAAGKLKGTPRYTLATSDAVIAFPQIPQDFSCAMGFPITKASTPKLYALMGRMIIDVGLSTYSAKNAYQRTRPFVAHNESTCYPPSEPALRKDGSYPSGHSALGWGWALVLAELNPDRADALFQRGRDFGQSRVICDAHWQSDVDAGRVVAAAAVARLHADPTFRADLDAARWEVVAQQARHLPTDSSQCSAEAAALKTP